MDARPARVGNRPYLRIHFRPSQARQRRQPLHQGQAKAIAQAATGKTPASLPKRPENRRVAPNQLRPRLKPKGKSSWSTTAEETSQRNAGSTIGIGPKNRGRKPKNSGSAGTAASPPSCIRHAAPHALRSTGSPAGSATLGGGPQLNPNPPIDGARTAKVGEGVTGAMIRARIRVDGKLEGDLQALLGHRRRPAEAVVSEMAG